jgi:hypothetical protein
MNPTPPSDRDALKRRNLRTALVLASIALAFFAGIIVKYVWLGR